MSAARRCESCEWWDRNQAPAAYWGKCRKEPPRAVTEGPYAGTVPLWPETKQIDWCGEWSPRKERTE